MSENPKLNSFLYEMYKIRLQYGYLIDEMQIVQNLFDKFYINLNEEDFIECKSILNKLEGILGCNNIDIEKAIILLDLEQFDYQNDPIKIEEHSKQLIKEYEEDVEKLRKQGQLLD